MIQGYGKTHDSDLSRNVYVTQWAQDAGILHAHGDGEEMVEDSSGTTPSNSTVIKNGKCLVHEDILKLES